LLTLVCFFWFSRSVPQLITFSVVATFVDRPFPCLTRFNWRNCPSPYFDAPAVPLPFPHRYHDHFNPAPFFFRSTFFFFFGGVFSRLLHCREVLQTTLTLLHPPVPGAGGRPFLPASSRPDPLLYSFFPFPSAFVLTLISFYFLFHIPYRPPFCSQGQFSQRSLLTLFYLRFSHEKCFPFL